MSTNSTADGLGFDEVNQESYTKLISGTNIYGTTGSFVNITSSNIASNEGALRSTSIDNASDVYGYKVKAGSLLMGNSVSGLVTFATPFASANWFMTLSARTYGDPQWSRTGSQGLAYGTSGARANTGCWVVGGSTTVVDWIAVGL
jgi:hypothetical protein